MTYCPDCKYFISCCLDKMAFYKMTGEDCGEFKPCCDLSKAENRKDEKDG
jgi:hypothetical protein